MVDRQTGSAGPGPLLQLGGIEEDAGRIQSDPNHRVFLLAMALALPDWQHRHDLPAHTLSSTTLF
jgi:hypothetical protein